MIIVLFIIWILILIGLLSCIYRCKYINTDISNSIGKLLKTSVVTVCGYVLFLNAYNKNAGYLFAALYCGSIDWLMLFFLRFLKIYTDFTYSHKKIKWIMYFIAMLDDINLLLNVKFKTAFSIGRIYYGKTGFNYLCNFRPLFYLHLAFIYLLIAFVILLLIKKMREVPQFYRKKYGVVLFTLAFVIVLNSMYIYSAIAVDISIPLYVLEAFLISYYALNFMPEGLVEKTLSLVVDDMNSGIICFDFQGKCIYANQLARDLFEVQDDIRIFEKYLPIWLERRHMDGEEASVWTEGHIYKDEEIYIKAEFKKIYDDKDMLIGYYFCMSDRTNEIEKYKSAVYRATHDNLTGIYTREKFYDRVNEVIHMNPDIRRLIICTKINNIQMINDLFGIEMGDEVLKQQAEILKEKAGTEYVYGRLIGDKFAMCVPKELFDIDSFVQKNAKISRHYHNKLFGVCINIGIYEVNDVDEPVSEMCDKAYIAIENVEENSECNVAYFDNDMMDEISFEKELIKDFDTALNERQFKINLQPRVSKSGRIHGAEVLVRWEHPKKGLIMPGRFISIFEKKGLIYQLDGWVWEQAIIQLKRWKDMGKENLYLSINISAKDFFYLDVYKILTGLVNKYEVDPSRLRLEITENVLMTETKTKLNVLSALRKIGFKIEVDDFGGGYSSLNMLNSNLIDNIKFDIRLFNDNINDEKKLAVLDATVLLTEKIGKGLLVEGVEKEEEANLIIGHGCEMFQGFYFSKPLSVDTFEKKFL
ncbi:EAL domain-containing protein [Butyribacter intestini]|uniref:EAL domain-containing protein n=2 Tax=Butyribacter intestini TaxID=1703332 RepID=UPI003AEFF73B